MFRYPFLRNAETSAPPINPPAPATRILSLSPRDISLLHPYRQERFQHARDLRSTDYSQRAKEQASIRSASVSYWNEDFGSGISGKARQWFVIGVRIQARRWGIAARRIEGLIRARLKRALLASLAGLGHVVGAAIPFLVTFRDQIVNDSEFRGQLNFVRMAFKPFPQRLSGRS
jgi:hypothetical protein